MPSALAPLALLLSFAPSPAPPTADDPRIAPFLEVAEEIRALTRTPGASFALVLDGQLAHLGGTGLRDVRRGRPATEDTLFAIGSCTKAMTGWLAATLMEEGRLDWDAPLRELLPTASFRDPYLTEHVRVRDLLTHATGLASYNLAWYGSRRARAQLLDVLPQLESTAGLRASYGYNNIGYAIAGCALESASGTDWETLIRERIFEPYGMEGSTVDHAGFLAHPERALGYAADGVTQLPHLDIDVIAPAGSIGSTARDMARWMLAVLERTTPEGEVPFPAQPFFSLTRPQHIVYGDGNAFYGMGWEVRFERGERIVRHGGGIVGQNGYVVLVPDAGFGLTILSNQQSDFDDLLVEYAVDHFVHGELVRDAEREAELAATASSAADEPPAMRPAPAPLEPNPLQPPTHPVASYAGVYRHAAFPELRLTPNGVGGLSASYNGFSGAVEHDGGERFGVGFSGRGTGFGVGLGFVTAESGAVEALELTLSSGVSPTRFERAGDGDRIAAVDRIVEGTLERYGIPGAGVAVLRRGAVLHRRFYGLADAAAGVAVTERTRFRLYSLTKLFVATGVFQLVEAGLLDLDAAIGDLLEDLPETWRGVTVRQLLAHAGGLPDLRELYHLPEPEARSKVYAQPLESRPGERYSYSLTGYWLLQRIVEAIAEGEFQGVILAGQFGPQERPPLFSADFRVPVEDAATPDFPFSLPHPQAHDYLDASNGLILTLDQFIDWSQRLEAHQVLAPALRAEMWSPFDYAQHEDFAHGWQVHPGPPERGLGFTGSMVTAFRIEPNSGLAVIFLGTGFEDFFDVDAVVDEVLGALR